MKLRLVSFSSITPWVRMIGPSFMSLLVFREFFLENVFDWVAELFLESKHYQHFYFFDHLCPPWSFPMPSGSKRSRSHPFHFSTFLREQLSVKRLAQGIGVFSFWSEAFLLRPSGCLLLILYSVCLRVGVQWIRASFSNTPVLHILSFHLNSLINRSLSQPQTDKTPKRRALVCCQWRAFHSVSSQLDQLEAFGSHWFSKN